MSLRFDVHSTPLAGLKLVGRKRLGDDRGYLERMFCVEELAELLPSGVVAQINHTYTRLRGTVRGMHFQHPPHAEIKFVSCLRGEVFDVAVDLRRDSPTFLHWHAEILSAENLRMFVIPEGFAHGFQSMTDNCELLYFHSKCYRAEFEDGLSPKDPRLKIDWPLPITEISQRDANHQYLNQNFKGIAK